MTITESITLARKQSDARNFAIVSNLNPIHRIVDMIGELQRLGCTDKNIHDVLSDLAKYYVAKKGKK